MSGENDRLLRLRPDFELVCNGAEALKREMAKLSSLADQRIVLRVWLAPRVPDVDVETVCTLCSLEIGCKPHAATAKRRAGRWSISCRLGAGTTALSLEQIADLDKRAEEKLGHA